MFIARNTNYWRHRGLIAAVALFTAIASLAYSEALVLCICADGCISIEAGCSPDCHDEDVPHAETERGHASVKVSRPTPSHDACVDIVLVPASERVSAVVQDRATSLVCYDAAPLPLAFNLTMDREQDASRATDRSIVPTAPPTRTDVLIL